MTTGPDPIRVLQLVTRMNIGGPARHVLALAQGMPPHIQVEVAAGRPPAVEGELTEPAVPVHPVPLVRPVSPRQDLVAIRAVRRLLRNRETRVLHTHMAKAGAIGRVAARGLPHVRTIHTFHGHVLSGYFSRPLQRAFLEAERRLARETDVLVAVSSEIRDALLDLGIGRPSQYEVVPIGTQIQQPAAGGRLRDALGLAPDVPLAGVVARLAPIKDHATLLVALVEVPRLHLAVLGDGELRNELERQASDMGLSGRVHFTGWWHDISSALVDLDMVVLTSRNEGTPVALLEAAAFGKPIVATDVGGVGAIVEDGVTGYLAASGDHDRIAGLLRRLSEDAELAARLGAEAH
ncbi:MAG: glycosyltransferase, partial [Actinomycetota bacterium]